MRELGKKLEGLPNEELFRMHSELVEACLNLPEATRTGERPVLRQEFLGSLMFAVTRNVFDEVLVDADDGTRLEMAAGSTVSELHFSPFAKGEPSTEPILRAAAMILGVSDLQRFMVEIQPEYAQGEIPDILRMNVLPDVVLFTRGLGLHWALVDGNPPEAPDLPKRIVVFGSLGELFNRFVLVGTWKKRLSQVMSRRYPALDERTARIGAIMMLRSKLEVEQE